MVQRSIICLPEIYRVTFTVTMSSVVSPPSSTRAQITYVPGSAKMARTEYLLSAGAGGGVQ